MKNKNKNMTTRYEIIKELAGYAISKIYFDYLTAKWSTENLAKLLKYYKTRKA